MLLQDHFRRQKKIPGIRLDIHTVEGTPMATAGPEMGAFIREELQRRGIGFFPQRHVTRVNGADRTVEFADGSSARYDLLVCIPPHEAPAVTRDAGLLNAAGWIAVDPHSMEAKAPGTDGRVFAIGDVTSVPLPGRFKPDLALSLPKAGVMAQAQGEVAARQIAARILGTTSDASFDGRGACYLETGGGQAVKAEGSFFALPHPVMEKKPPSEEQMRDKLAWVAELLTPRR
jgi:sulfide:quinone oxidoreductase